MRWGAFAKAQPRLAALGQQRLVEPGVLLVGTIRRDGTPRISPVEPLLWERDLWLSMLLGSYKAADLHRDSRLLLHSVVTGPDGAAGEYKLRGRALQETSAELQTGYAREVGDRLGWQPEPGQFHLFRVEIEDVTFIRYDKASGDQFVTRWPSGSEFVRRGTTATSLGPPQPHQEWLDEARTGP